MEETTLCYIENNGQFLMLHRNKEKNDINEGKWLGIGGHLENKETPIDACIREIKEETGLLAVEVKPRGIIDFHSDDIHEKMYLFTCDKFQGQIIECDEGTLKWIPKDKILDLNLWEGDKYFLDPLLNSNKFIEMEFYYNGDKLISVKEK